MNSTDLADLGFRSWRSFSLSDEKNLLDSLPRQMGVYAIRDTFHFGRYRGDSDIVYFGSTINSDGLRRRIRFYFHPGPSQHTSQRIRKILDQIPTLQIAWIQSEMPKEARSLEKTLLARYFNEHLELPPFNRQG